MLSRITQFNQRQVLRALVAGSLSVVGTLLGFGFFYFASARIWRFFSEPVPRGACLAIALGALGLIFLEGLRRARAGKGLYDFSESPGHLGLGSSSGGAMMIEMEVTTQVTGPAYILTQIFLCGPLQWQKMHTLLTSRFPATQATAEELERLLSDLGLKRGWQSLRKFETQRASIKKLIDMELVDFSPRTESIQLLQPS